MKELTAQQAFDFAKEKYMKQCETQLEAIYEDIETAAEEGRVTEDFNYIANQNVEALEKKGYLVTKTDTFFRVAWYDPKPEQIDPDPEDDPEPEPVDPEDINPDTPVDPEPIDLDPQP